jgi:hypothetical protein
MKKICVLLASISLVAVACGGDDDGDDGADTTTAASAATTAAAPATTAAGTSAPDGGASASSAPDTSTAGGGDEPADGGSFVSLESATESEAMISSFSASIDDLFGEFPTVTGETTRGVTDTSVNLGVVADFTFGGQPAFSGLCEGAKARAEKANADGELVREVNIVGCDDMSGDPSRATLVLNDYVKDKEAFALIAQAVLPFPTNILQEEHVPHFGWGFNLSWCGPDNPFAFGTTGAANCDAVVTESNDAKVVVTQVIEGLVFEALKRDGLIEGPADVRLAIIGEDTATAKESVANERRNAEAVGAEVVYAETPVPLNAATPDYSPYVQQIMSSDANAVFSLLSLGAQTPFLQALKQAGYEGVVYQTTATAKEFLQIPAIGPALDGVYALTVGTGNPAGTSAEWDEVRAAAEQQGVSVNSGFLHGYFGTEMFVQAFGALEQSGETITTENLVNLMNSGWSYPGFGDVFNGTNWPMDHYAGTSCSGVSRFDAEAKELVEVLPLSCGGREVVDS